MNKDWKNLNDEEKRVIEDKGTEKAFTGEYDDFWEEGIYKCKRCGVELFYSKNKFNSGCGWPAFDDEIVGAIKRISDRDGSRTEIQCVNCGAHLGHVFSGEKLTDKNLRHCVNSISLEFMPFRKMKNKVMKDKKHIEKVVFGGGCFWCTQAVFQKVKGVIKVTSGYAGGEKENPSYAEVSYGKTGHAEVVEVIFDSQIISFQNLMDIFMATHNPTTLNQQGADVGSQYRSVIFYTNEKQKEIAEQTIEKLNKEKVFTDLIVIKIELLSKFYEAEADHQNYFEKYPDYGYCQVVINPKISKLRDGFKKYLK